VEGTLNALCKRFLGYEAEYALRLSVTVSSTDRLTFLLQRYRTHLANGLATRILPRRSGLHVRHLRH
jgi:hypothetical protein